MDRAPTTPHPVSIDRMPTSPAPASVRPPVLDSNAPTPSGARPAPVLPPVPAALIARLADAAPPGPADPLALTPRNAHLSGDEQDGPTEIPEEEEVAAPWPGPKPKLLPEVPARASGPKSRLPEAPRAQPPPRSSGPKPKLPAEGATPVPTPRPFSPKARPDEETTPPPSPPAPPDNVVTDAKVPAMPPRSLRRGWMFAAAGLAVGCAVAVALYFFWTSEPASLGSVPLRGSFGAGAGVTWSTPAGKTFRYMPGRGPAVALLHYRAAGLAEGDLELAVNGQPVKSLEPTGAVAREGELVLPWEAVAAGAMEVSFIPRGTTAWRVEAPWVEEIQIPEGGQDALFAEAKKHAARGREFLDRSAASPDALFPAWEEYRLTWITLEPVQPHPALHAEAFAKYAAIGRTLDELCDGLLQAAEHSLTQGDVHSAKETLNSAIRYFPSGEHRCHNRAQQLLSENNL
jgi:hypothetical protein